MLCIKNIVENHIVIVLGNKITLFFKNSVDIFFARAYTLAHQRGLRALAVIKESG